MLQNIKNIKICGIKLPKNINFVTLFNSFFIGFIFYAYSNRFIGIIFPIETTIKKVGIIVNNTIEKIFNILQKYTINFVQLHGNESIGLYETLYKNNVCIIKVIKINNTLLSNNKKYINYTIIFLLFDNQCLEHGGSGKKFSWSKISKHIFNIPFFLSGGLGIKDVNRIKNVLQTKCFGIDLNSKFEIEPINKNRDEIKRFFQKIYL